MSSEGFLKTKTCVLKVSIHCEGCKHSVKRILRNIEGVYTVKVDSDVGKVTVVGNYNLDPEILVHKLQKKGKYVHLWDAPKINNNNTYNLENPLKNLHLSTENGGGNIICNNQGKNQPLVDDTHGQSPQITQLQQGATEEQKLPVNKEQPKKKSVTFSVPSDDLTDKNELDDDDYDAGDETDIAPLNKTKSIKVTRHANGAGPKIRNEKNHQFMKKRGNSSGSANVDAGNAKTATQINIKGGCASQDSAKDKKSNGKNTQDGSSKSGGITNVPKKGHELNNTPQENHNMLDMNGTSGGQMNNIASLHGLQASGIDDGGSGSGSGGAENSKRPGLEQMDGNEQQYSISNEISQPMMNVPHYDYNIMYMPYATQDTVAPPPIRRDDDYTFFSDEDTKSCIVM